MEKDNLKHEQQCAIHDVSNSVDFWKDAQEFLKTQLPDDFQEKLDKYVTDKGYNSNECRLFKSMLTEAVGLYGTVMVIKHCC